MSLLFKKFLSKFCFKTIIFKKGVLFHKKMMKIAYIDHRLYNDPGDANRVRISLIKSGFQVTDSKNLASFLKNYDLNDFRYLLFHPSGSTKEKKRAINQVIEEYPDVRLDFITNAGISLESDGRNVFDYFQLDEIVEYYQEKSRLVK